MPPARPLPLRANSVVTVVIVPTSSSQTQLAFTEDVHVQVVVVAHLNVARPVGRTRILQHPVDVLRGELGRDAWVTEYMPPDTAVYPAGHCRTKLWTENASTGAPCWTTAVKRHGTA